MQLTPRADKIIRILLRFSPDSPVTIGIISEELGVSDRSVQRELPTVEKWMKHNGFCFVRKRSVGLLIDETPERLKELAALLDEKDTDVYKRQTSPTTSHLLLSVNYIHI